VLLKESAPTEAANPAHEELLGKLDEASSQYNKDAKTYSKQLGQKFAKGNAAYEQQGGLSGYRAKLGSMRGKKESGFQPLQVSDETANSLLDHVQSLDIPPAQKLNAQTAILKVIGHHDGAPTPADIRYIRDAFGDEDG
jgi:adenine specific DNA methylase Mod